MELADFWYPVCLSDELNGKPIGSRLLGTPLVVFRGEDGRPGALLDQCPHRRAMLSAGRVKDGTVECTYHGWRFAPDGACVRVPGHDGEPKGCARGALAFATREQDGMVFVYGRPGDAPTEPYKHPRTNDPRYGTFVRQFRCRGTLALALDNFMDVMHPPFLHPGMLYDDDDRKRVDVTVRKWVAEDQPAHAGVEAVYTGEPSPTRGWIGKVVLAGRWYEEAYHVERFIAPCAHQNEYAVAENGHMYVTCYNTPEDDEHMRLFMLCVYRLPLPHAVSRFLIDRFLVGPTVQQDVDFFDAHHEVLRAPHPDVPEQSTVLDTHGLRVRAFMRRLGAVSSLSEIEIPETQFVGWM